MEAKARDRHGEEFTLGYLVATAHVARKGEDTLAIEMLRECGITTAPDLSNRGLELFDRKPLSELLRRNQNEKR